MRPLVVKPARVRVAFVKGSVYRTRNVYSFTLRLLNAPDPLRALHERARRLSESQACL